MTGAQLRAGAGGAVVRGSGGHSTRAEDLGPVLPVGSGAAAPVRMWCGPATRSASRCARAALYHVAVNDFLVGGGDDFKSLRRSAVEAVGPLDSEALERYLKSLHGSSISAPAGPRIFVTGGTPLKCPGRAPLSAHILAVIPIRMIGGALFPVAASGHPRARQPALHQQVRAGCRAWHPLRRRRRSGRCRQVAVECGDGGRQFHAGACRRRHGA